jgi:replicative DNA helicase
MTNIAAEKVFLAGVVRHPTKLFEYIEYLDEDDFHHTATCMTFEALRSLVVDKEAEKVTKAKLVAEAKALGHQNFLSATKNGEWLDELIAEEVTTNELDAHFMEVKRQSLKSKYLDSFSELRDYLSTTDDPLSIMIGKVENDVVSKVNILDKGEHAIQDMREGFQEFLESLAEDPGHMGLDIGYPLWQERIGQIRNGTITFIVGTTGSGKSQFGMKAAVIAARKGIPVLYLDSELSKHDQWVRMAAMLAKVPSEYVETGFVYLNESQLRDNGVTDQTKIDEIIAYGRRLRDPRLWEAVQKMPIFYQSISGLTVPDVIPHMRRWLLTHVKPDRETRAAQCLIVYDYIKLSMTTEISRGVLAEWQQHGLHVSHLHDFANRYNIPIIGFGQTNNELDEGIRCVAGGKRISENVDSVSYFKRKTDAERANDSSGTHMAKIFKSRYGRGLWGGYINFNADLRFGEFTELDLGSVRPPETDEEEDDDDDN